MDSLDHLPLELLLALRDAVADPTEQGVRRAQQRAADAGYHIECLNELESPGTPRVLAEPIAMESAPDDLEALDLVFRVAESG